MIRDKYAVRLAPEQREELQNLIRVGKSSARVTARARILLKSGDSWAAPKVAEWSSRPSMSARFNMAAGVCLGRRRPASLPPSCASPRTLDRPEIPVEYPPLARNGSAFPEDDRVYRLVQTQSTHHLPVSLGIPGFCWSWWAFVHRSASADSHPAGSDLSSVLTASSFLAAVSLVPGHRPIGRTCLSRLAPPRVAGSLVCGFSGCQLGIPACYGRNRSVDLGPGALKW